MILTTSVFLTGLGMAAWIAGFVLDMPGVAAIGGVLVVGVGAMVMVDGLQHRDGKTETVNDTTNTTTVQYDYKQVNTLSSFPLGAMLTLMGGVQVLRSMDNTTEFGP